MQVRVDDRGQQHEGVLSARDFGRHTDHARHYARRLDDGDARFASKRVASGKLDNEVEALVDDLRERVGRIESDRREQRPDLALEIVGYPGALRGVAFGAAQHAHSRGVQRRQDLLVERSIHRGDQRLRAQADFADMGL